MRDYDKVTSLELVQGDKVSTVRYFADEGVGIKADGIRRKAYLMRRAPSPEEMFRWVTSYEVPVGCTPVDQYIANNSHAAKRMYDSLLFPNGVTLRIFPENRRIDLYIVKGDTYLEEFSVVTRHPVTTMDDAIAELANQGIL